LCTEIDLMYTMITSIEFWVGFMIKFLITELINLKPMNSLKIVVAGVGAIIQRYSGALKRK